MVHLSNVFDDVLIGTLKNVRQVVRFRVLELGFEFQNSNPSSRMDHMYNVFAKTIE